MKKIVILDTWVNNGNLGNKVIMEGVCQELQSAFPGDFIYNVPALEYIRSGRRLVQEADFVFLAGTNVLCSDMNEHSEWRVRLRDLTWLRGVILMGLGWWQYQDFRPNLYTRILLGGILRKDVKHSLRDSYTTKRILDLGYQSLNTGCPSIWRLTKAHCGEIPRSKADIALVTFTEYNQKPEKDRLVMEILRRNYSKMYFWPQQFGDYSYIHQIGTEGVTILNPTLEALDEILRAEKVDFVGTRLHAGIRALQHKRRAIIITVDNRATEMGADFNLPIIHRDRIHADLEQTIGGSWPTDVRLDVQAIAEWKSQFSRSTSLD